MPSPRILATGFGPFPGAPSNPTERLMGWLSQHASRPRYALQTRVLDVDYGRAVSQLEAAVAASEPDILVMLGLSARAQGFTLEKLARNEIVGGRPDHFGNLPAASHILEGGGDRDSTLPLEAIHRALSGAGLPVSWSDDAGGYLCNYVFYAACAGLCRPLTATMAGFVHVPHLADVPHGSPAAMPREQMEAGARLIIETCAAEWERRAGG